jgi:hypothetical protein
LLVISLSRQRNLRTDPSTIASVMAMVANNQPLLSDFADLDCCTMDDVQKILGEKRYKLINDEGGTRQVVTRYITKALLIFWIALLNLHMAMSLGWEILT